MSWLDRYLVPDWRLLHKFWSMRLAFLTAILGGLWVALPAFQNYLPPMDFAMICVIASVLIMLARVTHQKGLPDV